MSETRRVVGTREDRLTWLLLVVGGAAVLAQVLYKWPLIAPDPSPHNTATAPVPEAVQAPPSPRVAEDVEWIEPRSIDLTLAALALPLTSLQATRPELVDRLLDTPHSQLADVLEENGIRLRELAGRTAEADRVRPLVFLSSRDEDPWTRVRQAEVSPDALSRRCPAIVVLGPRANVLVLFQPEPRRAFLPREPLGDFALARFEVTPAADRGVPIYYGVHPDRWKPRVEVVHRVCSDARRVTSIVTKLQYDDGRTETLRTKPEPGLWLPCEAESGGMSRYDVKQVAAAAAGPPFILAGAYVLDETTTPSALVSRYLEVGR